MYLTLHHRRTTLWLIAICLLPFALTTVASAQEPNVVTVTGQGIDEDGAVKDALRKAVEQGGKNEIASRTKTKDFALEFDVVLARASGLVKKHEILSKKSSNGVHTVKIKAWVSANLIDATWADVAIELKKLGRPKIMVMFKEVIHDLDRPEGSREIVQRSSILGKVIERRLMKLGFKLVNPSQIKEIDRKKIEIATADDDTATLKAIASSHGAAIYIKGQSRASGPQRTNSPAGLLHMWETDVTIEAFWTETGDMIFSNATTGTRGGSRVAGPPGGIKAMESSGKKLAQASIFDLLEAWTRGTAGGVGDVIVEVRNVQSARQAIAIKKALAALDGVEDVTKEGLKGTVKFTVVSARGAEELLEPIVELEFDGFTMEVEDQKTKTIICTIQ